MNQKVLRRNLSVPLSRPCVSEQGISAVCETLRSGWLTAGPKVSEFESELSRSFDGRPVAAVSSCTAALHLALILAGVGKGDEVITTPMTFAATANVILMVGARPVFADIDPTTWNIDLSAVEAAITNKTKAILPVHFAGRPCDMDALNALAKRRGIRVIEDAAQALGAVYNGRRIGCGENFVCFSFHPMKQITTVEGGALVLPDESMLPRARRLRFHGIEKDAWKTFQGLKQHEPYDINVLGYKYNLNDVAATLGLGQLKREKEWSERRTAVAETYLKEFFSTKGLTLPLGNTEDNRSAWNLFHVLLDGGSSREEFMGGLKGMGVATGIYYRALHLTSLYKEVLGPEFKGCPHAEVFSERAVALPMFSTITDKELLHVVRSVKEMIAELSHND